ncbi:hypothetical protein HDU81_009086 [Chytriomyces hyalinus]|nr:hypothetical protein HDU81_009086 [Chytriomyces hyalinus]
MYQKQAQDNAEKVLSLEMAVANLQKQNSLLRSLVSNGGGDKRAASSSTLVQASNAFPSMTHQRSMLTGRSTGRTRFHTFSAMQPTGLQSMYQSSSMFEPSMTSFDKSNSFIDFQDFGTSSSSSAATISNSLEQQLLCPSYSVLEPAFISSTSSSMEDSVAESSGSITEGSIMGGGSSNLLASPEMGFATLQSFPTRPYQESNGAASLLSSDISADRKFIASLPGNGFEQYANLLNMTH